MKAAAHKNVFGIKIGEGVSHRVGPFKLGNNIGEALTEIKA